MVGLIEGVLLAASQARSVVQLWKLRAETRPGSATCLRDHFEPNRGWARDLLWMVEILHHFETRAIFPGFLRWCEMDFVHPQYGLYVLGRVVFAAFAALEAPL